MSHCVYEFSDFMQGFNKICIRYVMEMFDNFNFTLKFTKLMCVQSDIFCY